ncbi:hypothetical protein J3D48_004942 [Pseudomonas fluorescens]|nr:hypothetical protein [Pseudomonas fluorescens]
MTRIFVLFTLINVLAGCNTYSDGHPRSSEDPGCKTAQKQAGCL